MSRLERTLLYARTLRHLRPAQVAHRARLRAQRVAFARFPDQLATRLRRPVPLDAAWPTGFVPIDGRLAEGFPSPEVNAQMSFCFLNETRSVGGTHDWDQAGAAHLWRFHLHYFEWAWSFAAHPDADWAQEAFGRLWQSWRAHTRFGGRDAWAPYVVALRAWALCGVHAFLIRGSGCNGDFIEDLALHAGYLRANLERDLGGNHLLKNLKALIGLGVFLGDEGLFTFSSHELERQIGVQVLSDGGHYERSPSYHCQVLSDLIDIQSLLVDAGRHAIPALEPAIASMRRWLGAMLLPDGDVPLFNDCTLVGTRRLALLRPTPPELSRLTVLQPSGYVVIRPDDRLHLVVDVGPPCPLDLPGHAHADCLSFELALDGRRIIVDTGTSTYEAGPRRSYERSTAAHNTVEIDGQNQTEVWGVFRAARRATPTLERVHDDGVEIVVTATHDGYRRLKGQPIHRRALRVRPGRIEVTDEILSTRTHHGVARLHVAPGAMVTLGANAVVIGPLTVEASEPMRQREDYVATDFGTVGTTDVVEVHLNNASPQRSVLSLHLANESRSS